MKSLISVQWVSFRPPKMLVLIVLYVLSLIINGLYAACFVLTCHRLS